MKLSYTREDWNTADHRWIGSSHGVDSTKGIMLDISDSDWVLATHYPDGFLLAGILVVETGTAGFWKPFDPGVDPNTANTVFPLISGGIQVVDAATDADPSAAILVHGQLRAQFLPAPYEAMTAAQYGALGSQLTLTPAA